MRLRADLAYREIDGEYYFLSADSMFHAVTDPVGSFILSLVEKHPGVTAGEIARDVETEFDAAGADIGADVEAFLSELVKKGIVETA